MSDSYDEDDYMHEEDEDEDASMNTDDAEDNEGEQPLVANDDQAPSSQQHSRRQRGGRVRSPPGKGQGKGIRRRLEEPQRPGHREGHEGRHRAHCLNIRTRGMLLNLSSYSQRAV
jgi:hypothetical protein